MRGTRNHPWRRQTWSQEAGRHSIHLNKRLLSTLQSQPSQGYFLPLCGAKMESRVLPSTSPPSCTWNTIHQIFKILVGPRFKCQQFFLQYDESVQILVYNNVSITDAAVVLVESTVTFILKWEIKIFPLISDTTEGRVVVAHDFNSSTWETEASESSASSTELVLG